MERPLNLHGKGAITDTNPRCWRCHKLIAEVLTRPWSIKCVRCKANNNPETNPPWFAKTQDTL